MKILYFNFYYDIACMIFSSISYFTWENYYNLFDEINNSDFEKIIFRKSNKCSIEKHLIGYSTSDADCN